MTKKGVRRRKQARHDRAARKSMDHFLKHHGRDLTAALRHRYREIIDPPKEVWTVTVEPRP